MAMELLQSDADLWRLIKQENQKAFDTLFGRYWKPMFYWALKLTNQKEVAQTIVQDIFITLWERKAEISIDNVEAYLFKAVKFQSYKYYRDNQQFNLSINEVDQLEEPIEEVAEDDERVEKLNKAVDALPEKCREIFVMRKIHDFSIEQIAAHLGLSPQTVKNQIGKAFKQIRTSIDV